MYANKMAVAIKTNGRVLREHKDTVFIPFGSEYQITMKNLNTTRALVNVFIDGTNIVEGGLVLNAGQEVDLERSIINGNLTAGNKLKFIERTKAVEDGPRGIKLEDGLIRIEFQYEVPRPVLNIGDQYWSKNIVGSTGITRDMFYATNGTSASGVSGSLSSDRFSVSASGSTSQMNVNGVMRGVDYSKGETTKAVAASATSATLASMGIKDMEAHDGAATMDWMPTNDVGITVPGSRSEQKFATTTMGTLEAEKHTIVLKILGETPDNKAITEAVTVKFKPECPSCGKLNKAKSKFCVECGTGLRLFS